MGSLPDKSTSDSRMKIHVMNRRVALKTLVLGAEGLRVVFSPAKAQKTLEPVRIASLESLIINQTLEFTYANQDCLLVVQKAPEKPNPRGLIVTRGNETLMLLGFSRICTHAGCTVDAPNQATAMFCPCHGSEFDALSGRVVSGPARRGLDGVQLELRALDVWAAGWL